MFATKFSSIFLLRGKNSFGKLIDERAIWWDLYNKHISIFYINYMSTIFRTR